MSALGLAILLLSAATAPGLAQDDDAAPIEARANLQAELGYWYDAFATLEALRAAHPEEERLRDFEAALLEQVGLGDVAASLSR